MLTSTECYRRVKERERYSQYEKLIFEYAIECMCEC